MVIFFLGDLTENQVALPPGDLAACSEQAPVRVLDLRTGVRFCAVGATKENTPPKWGAFFGEPSAIELELYP